MTCSKCGADNREGARFCDKCGARLSPRCASGGAENRPDARFCDSCGAALGADAAVAALAAKPNDTTIRVVETPAAESLEGERKTVTVLFADIKGSMDLIEDLDPEEARAIIDPALKLMMEAVQRYGGYVAQPTGDGIFALYGAPVAHEDHPQRALFAALRLQEQLKGYSHTLRTKGRVPVQARVGLNTGEVVMRSLKTGEGHTETTPIGHAISLAARMQTLAPGGSIAATEATRKLGEGYFTFKSLGPAVVKGVSEPVEVFEVTGLGPFRTRLQLSARRGLSKFVGRQAEMETLQRGLEVASGGHGQIVAVVGEAGLGKSRLFHEFKEIVRGRAAIAEAYSVSYGKASPYLPIIELLKSYFEIATDDSARRRREKITGRLLTLDQSLADALPHLLALLGAVEGEDPLAQMDAQVRRRRTLEALKRLVLRESLYRLVIIIFEDLHCIDTETEAFLNLLAEGIANARVLMLVNYRPEYRHTWGNRTYYTQLRLDPLGKESTEQLLVALLGEGKDLIPLKRLITQKAEGNPFFIDEVVQALFEQGVLAREGTVRLVKSKNQIQLPATVQGVLASRTDRLPADEKALLQRLAVVGSKFLQSLARRVAGVPEDELTGMLSDLQLGEFIYEQPAMPEAEYVFKHALTQEVAYNSLRIERRKALHQRTAEAIEELYSDRLEDHLAELAHHYERSANMPKAVEYLDRAGEQARRRSAYADAIAHFRRGVELLAHLPEGRERDAREVRLQHHLAYSLAATQGNGVSGSGQAYVRAKELSERIGDARELFTALTGLATFYSVGSDLKKAREVGQELSRMTAAAQEPVAVLVAHSTLVHIFFWLADYCTSLQHANQGLMAFDLDRRLSPSLETARVNCLVSGAFDLFQLGYPDQSLARCDEALNVSRERGYPLPLAIALFGTVVVHAWRGDAKAAQEQAHMLLALTKENGFASFYERLTLGVLGQALAMQSRCKEGLAECRRGLAMTEGIGMVETGELEWSLAWCCWKAGKVEEALEAVATGLTLSNQTGSGCGRSNLYRLKGELLLMKERDESAAEASFKTAIDIARSQQEKSHELAATTSLARLLAKQGKRNEARAMLAEIYNWFTEGFDPADLKDAKALLDELSA